MRKGPPTTADLIEAECRLNQEYQDQNSTDVRSFHLAYEDWRNYDQYFDPNSQTVREEPMPTDHGILLEEIYE